MKAEIITVGTEILMGQIVNTNAAYLSQELNHLGFDLYFETAVGDNPQRLLQVLELASQRSDLVVLTGGLGPTTDDLTKQTVAEFLGVPLKEEPTGIQQIQAYFKKLHRVMTENNRLQALYLAGGEFLKNPTGLALGSFIEKNDTHYLLLPGPPSELIPMFQQEAVPLLLKMLPQEGHLYSETLRFYGIGESQLVTKLADLIDHQTNPTIAPYAKELEVTLRITAKEQDEAKGQEKVTATKAEILELVGEYYYGSGEENSLEETLVKTLTEKKMTITAAESFTAGLFQSTLGSVSGASKVFPGGLVTYANEAKVNLLGVSKELIDTYGVVSEEVAKAMAETAQKKIGTDLAVSFTGAAGPTPLEGHKPGTCFIGLAKKGQRTQVFSYEFQGDRNKVRRRGVKEACWLLLKNC